MKFTEEEALRNALVFLVSFGQIAEKVKRPIPWKGLIEKTVTIFNNQIRSRDGQSQK